MGVRKSEKKKHFRTSNVLELEQPWITIFTWIHFSGCNGENVVNVKLNTKLANLSLFKMFLSLTNRNVLLSSCNENVIPAFPQS